MTDQGLLVPAGVLADADLRPAAKLVLARLLELARGHGLAFRSRSALAADLGLGCRTVEAALRSLEAKGWLALEVSHNGRSRPRGFRVKGAAQHLANLPATTADEGADVGPGRVKQLTLFDTSPSKAEGIRSPGFVKT
jgi:hypothetical protein